MKWVYSDLVYQIVLQWIIVLVLFTGKVGAQSSPDTSKSISRQQSNIGVREDDPALTSWRAKKKFFIVAAATSTGGINTSLPYANVDGRKVEEVLMALGYTKLDTLIGKEANHENLVEALKKVRTVKDNGLVVIYYSGHGVSDTMGDDVWLQLSGQKFFGASHGLSVSQMVKTARIGYGGRVSRHR